LNSPKANNIRRGNAYLTCILYKFDKYLFLSHLSVNLVNFLKILIYETFIIILLPVLILLSAQQISGQQRGMKPVDLSIDGKTSRYITRVMH
jgi:hypothetical protein